MPPGSEVDMKRRGLGAFPNAFLNGSTVGSSGQNLRTIAVISGHTKDAVLSPLAEKHCELGIFLITHCFGPGGSVRRK